MKTFDKKEILRDSIFAFIMRIFSTAIGFILTFVVAKNMLVDQAGLFMLSFAIITVLTSVSTLGMRISFVRFIGGYDSIGNHKIVNGTFISGAIGSFIATLLISGLIYYFRFNISENIFNNEKMESLLEIIAYILPFISLHLLISYAFQGKRKTNISVIFEKILSYTLFILLFIFFLSSNIEITALDGLRLFLYSSVFCSLVSVFCWIREQKFNLNADFSINKQLVSSSYPVWLAAIATMVIEWGGQIISGIYLPSSDVAIYAISQRVASFILLILVAINLVSAPRFAAAYKQNNMEDLRKTSLLCSRLMFLVATPLFFIMYFAGDILLNFFGEEYSSGILYYKIILLGYFFNVLTGSVGYLLNMTGNEKIMRNIIFISGAVLLFLSFLLIPRYGILGASIATTSAIFLQNLFALIAVRKNLVLTL